MTREWILIHTNACIYIYIYTRNNKSFSLTNSMYSYSYLLVMKMIKMTRFIIVQILATAAEEKDWVSKRRWMFAAASSFTRYRVTYGKGTVTTGREVWRPPTAPSAAHERHESCRCCPTAFDETEADTSVSQPGRGVRGARQVPRILPQPEQTCAYG